MTAEPCSHFMPELRALDSMHWRLLAMAMNENAAIQALVLVQQQQTLSRRVSYALQ